MHPYSTSLAVRPDMPATIHHPHQTFTLPTAFSHGLHCQGRIPSPVTDSTISKNAIPLSPTRQLDSADTSSVTSCSGCSHCSGLSNQTQLDNNDNIDRRTLLRTSGGHTVSPLTQWNYVSKQVYIWIEWLLFFIRKKLNCAYIYYHYYPFLFHYFFECWWDQQDSIPNWSYFIYFSDGQLARQAMNISQWLVE